MHGICKLAGEHISVCQQHPALGIALDGGQPLCVPPVSQLACSAGIACALVAFSFWSGGCGHIASAAILIHVALYLFVHMPQSAT
jgi:hypothetical protein